MAKITAEEIVKRLTNPSFIRVKPNLITQTVKTKYLGVMLMESLCSYQENPATFGYKDRSFNAVMKAFLDKNIGSNPRAKRAKALAKIIHAYKAGPRIAFKNNKVGRSTLPAYLARKGNAQFHNAVSDMQIQRVDGRRPLIPAAIVIPEASPMDDRRCRRIQAHLQEVFCDDRSEASTDELYFMTGATLSDFTGTWEEHTRLSDRIDGVDDPNPVPLPEPFKRLFDFKIQNPGDAYSLSPLTALCTITLMERDQSSRQRVYSAFQAAYNAANLLAAIAQGTAGGPVGVAIAVATILILLILALDGDDELGTVAFRFDDVLASNAPPSKILEGVIDDSQKGNHYRYLFTVRYQSTDYDCPVDPPFRIVGPTERTIRNMVPTWGGYALISPVPVENIEWRVTPAGATVGQQGKRYTSIHFSRSGTFTVSVSADPQAGGVTLTDTHTVQVTDLGGIPY